LAHALASPQRVVPYLIELIGPHSVLDVGCGPGSWLEEFIARGVDDVLGMDGQWLDTSVLRIPRDRVKLQDLTAPVELGREFDLALSLEVAEHLPAGAAAEIVATLTRHAPVVAFSAAAPLQGGTHHVNEQWPDYWAALFAERGFVSVDALRPRFWLDDQLAWYYRQNMFLALREDVLPRYPALADEYARSGGRMLPLVHPDRYLRIAASSPTRVKDSVMAALYERWPATRGVRDSVRSAVAKARPGP
jgi:SAM-dependent methyltransferase